MACKCQKISFHADKDSRSHLILSEYIEKKKQFSDFLYHLSLANVQQEINGT